MNYVIQNGKDSREIKGLLISELPAISKPAVRTDITEIDGRDGDIVSVLGYSAYDKHMTIGLFGDYDIDEIIPFFSTSGTVTFSNEPERYYRYQIINQIDFARLVRFRTAEVVYHVQPFKYSTIETVKKFSKPSGSITVRNNGNYISRPVIEITGTGTITLSLNGLQLFNIEMGTNSAVTIDTENMEAYNGSVLMNRNVQGDYDAFALNVGVNDVVVSGTVSSISFKNYSRWI